MSLDELKEKFIAECTYKLQKQYTDTYRQFSLPPDDIFYWFVNNMSLSDYKKHVLNVLKENQEAAKNLTDEDKGRTAQDIINETYEDLISIFSK